MIDLTPAARQRLDEYLQRVRVSFRGSSLAADDLEQSVREHVDIALSGQAAPVGAEHLCEVLDRLGPPERWLTDDELPPWKRWMNRLRSGPEDWRLAYASLALFVVAILTAPAGGLLLLIPAFILSRAYIEYVQEKGERLGQQRWLVYPPIAVALALGVAILIVGPVPGFVAWAAEANGFELMQRTIAPGVQQIRFNIGIVVLAFGVWWLVASLLAMASVRLIRAAFFPLVDHVRKRTFAALTLIGVLTGAAGAATALL